ncbi:serine O-acetyltransferase [Duganella ginsengisoli]|uniref:Serine acetyltransferase n=2 Tax=Pseudoduganella ginsengisoli TaxID=1462440 RepID=A0A6L6PYT2_9BURK|nr:serine O-acetyltransferase [Pseudoduganella ginsengisoli]
MARQNRIWDQMRAELQLLGSSEPAAQAYLHSILGAAADFQSALAALLSHHLFSTGHNGEAYPDIVGRIISQCRELCDAAAADLEAFCERDPASQGVLQVFFFSKGFLALQSYRVSHVLWLRGQHLSAHMLQMKTSLVCAVDIHPAARLGQGIFLDHATGLVIGETTVVEDEVSILHEVTLGGTGKHRGDRHPKIRRGALLCAGAKILGNIEVGEGAKVGAGSVVLRDVPAHMTVAGVPARTVGFSRLNAAIEMDQALND